MTPPKSIRVILTPQQTAEVIRQAGGVNHHGRAFAMLAPGSYPTAPGVLILDVFECASLKVAQAAVDVATGKATAHRKPLRGGQFLGTSPAPASTRAERGAVQHVMKSYGPEPGTTPPERATFKT